MTKHTDKALQKAINDIKDCIKLGMAGKQAYYNQFQTAIEIYINNFERFNGNVTPLKQILLPLGKDRPLMVEYIKKVTNIESIYVNKEDKLSVKVEDSFQINTELMKSCRWFDKNEKADKSPLVLDDKAFQKAIISLYNRFTKSDELTDKESKLGKLSELMDKTSTIRKIIA